MRALFLLLQVGWSAALLGTAAPLIGVARWCSAGQPACMRAPPTLLRMGACGEAEEAEANERRATYLRARDAREQQLLPSRVDMTAMFEGDTCPEYIERWGGMHRQSAMEGPTRQALQMVVEDSEWCADSWESVSTPTDTFESTPTPSN